MRPVFVHAASVTRFGRRVEPLVALARHAGERALRDAGDPRVDHVFVASQAPEALAGEGNVATLVASALGLVPVAATRVESGPSSGASALEAATRAIASGAVDTALVVGVESMTHRPTPEVTRVLATMLDARERALGATMPAFAALTARAYMDRFGATREDLARPPVLAHAAGALNPDAHFRKETTVESVLASPMVADPLHVFHCAPVSDGAAAVVLSARPGPVRVLATGHATAAHAVSDRTEPDALTRQSATAHAAHRAFERAGRAPRDVDVVELHDAFAPLYFTGLESLGFFRPGEAFGAVRRGDAGPAGAVVAVNPGGGLKARGHPVGATGVAQWVELFRQLTGTADARQVAGARTGLAHAIGGYASNVVVSLLEAAE